MSEQKTLLVFGATGQTGRPFVDLALHEGHRVRAVVRSAARLGPERPGLDVHQGSITEALDLDRLLRDVDFVIAMLGDADAQRRAPINTRLVRQLVPAMRRQGVTRFLYQAGGFSTPPHRRLPLAPRVMRSIIARPQLGQHRDNEAVMRYLTEEAVDIEWIVHRAALRPGDGSRGVLQRSDRKISIATFRDCAAYNYRTLMDATAIHTCDTSHYGKQAATPTPAL